MNVLALDLSTKTGWVVFNDAAQPDSFGLIHRKTDWNDLSYPLNFLTVAEEIADQVVEIYKQSLCSIDKVVIEETNKTGRFGSRHSQKILEFIHFAVNLRFRALSAKVYYVNSSDWRRTLKLSVAETKKAAKPFLKELDLAKKALAQEKDPKKKKAIKERIQSIKQDLKARCIHGKIDKKSISVAYANATWNMNLKKGDNDIADALCLGKAFLSGAPVVTNEEIFQSNTKE